MFDGATKVNPKPEIKPVRKVKIHNSLQVASLYIKAPIPKAPLMKAEQNKISFQCNVLG